MRWNLRMTAAECSIWKSTELRQLLASEGLEVSAGKMSGWWTGTPNSIRLDELDVLCAVLDCDASALLVAEPDQVASRRPARPSAEAAGPTPVTPRFGRGRSVPPV